MALDQFTIVRPNQKTQQSNPGSDDLELVIEQFTGQVEQVLARKSVLDGFVQVRPVKGTATLTNYAAGDTGLQVLEPGKIPDGQKADFSKASVTVDTVVLARHTLPLLDVFQTQFDARKEISQSHGQRIAKFRDQAFFIQGLRAALATTNPYGDVSGFNLGTKVTMPTADATDPAALYAAIGRMFAEMEEKDVDPQGDNLILAMRPKQFYDLMQAEQIINGQYVTADGTTKEGFIFKAFGVPVVRSNNLPVGKVITGHELSNARNGNGYDGDFSKCHIVAFSPRAILAGETIPLQTDVYYDKISKSWYVDSHLSFAATVNRTEFAGVLNLA